MERMDSSFSEESEKFHPQVFINLREYFDENGNNKANF